MIAVLSENVFIRRLVAAQKRVMGASGRFRGITGLWSKLKSIINFSQNKIFGNGSLLSICLYFFKNI